MFKGCWIILKWSVKVRLGRMPCVTGFGKQAKVRDMKFPDQMLTFRQAQFVIIRLKMWMYKYQTRQYRTAQKEEQHKSA